MAEAAFSRLASDVGGAAPGQRLLALRDGARALIRLERAGLLDKHKVESEIARVANDLDAAGEIGEGDADAVWEILGQANGTIPLPEGPAPAVTEAGPAPEVAAAPTHDEGPIDESSPDDERRAAIPWQATEALGSWNRTLTGLRQRHHLANKFLEALKEIFRFAEHEGITDRAHQQLVDDLWAMGSGQGLDDVAIQSLMQAATMPGRAAMPEEPPSAEHPGDYGAVAAQPAAKASTHRIWQNIHIKLPAGLPITTEDWRHRDLPPPDFVAGSVLTTTTRGLISAKTGLGKSIFLMAWAQRMAAGHPFLHWKAQRSVKVLYVDGEMSRRLLKERFLAEESRHDGGLTNFFLLSHEDIRLHPLNTPAGQAWMLKLIDHLGVEFVIFDNIMSLTVGDQKDPLVWQQTLPFALELTRLSVGQLWVHHAGHDTSKGYGDKSREWQMDTVAHLDAVEREDTDVSFTLTFPKARERTPATRLDFQDAKIALVNDRWQGNVERRQAEHQAIRPAVQKALEALTNVIASDHATTLPGNRRAAHRDHWAAECNTRGLVDLKAKGNSARTLMNTFRRELVGANRIACEGDMQWLL